MPSTVRLHAIEEISTTVYQRTNPDSAYYYAKLQYDYAVETKSEVYKASALRIQGHALRLMGNSALALNILDEAIDIYTRLGDKAGVADILHLIGAIHIDQANQAKALPFLQRAHELRLQVGDRYEIARSYNTLGYLYDDAGEYEKALEHHNKCLAIRIEINDLQGISWCYNNMARVYFHQANYTEAEKWYLESIALKDSLNEYTVGETKGNLGMLYLATDRINAAISICEEGYQQSVAIGFDHGVRITCECLYKGYKAEQNTDKALRYYETYIELRDSIFSVQTTKELLQSELQYKFQMREALTVIESRKRVAVAEEQEQKQRIITYALTVGAILLFAFLLLLFKWLQKSKKQQYVIESQKAIVDQKNHEIMDSINYAKRIQEAILTPQRIIHAILPDSFILYKPKDVVAGDFYWLEEHDNLVVFAVADCTGHGVPGAMVSVVCNNALNRAVREFNLSEPGQILDKTRELVIKQFEKSEDRVKDGMDISLCVLNKESLELKWAGANNPIWIVRNGEVLVTKGDKQPIAYHPNSAPFTTHNIKTEKGDAFYLFSDGYADQFGGHFNKKFKSVAFKKLLIEVEGMPMEAQKHVVNETFEQWRGVIEQLDDVCVLGFRL